MIRVGDRVKFMSDTGEGVVRSINGTIAVVEVEDGFDIPATLDDLVAVAKEEELRAISMIGVSDPKPGRAAKNSQKSPEEQSERKPRFSSAQRYGRVSVIDQEDGEAIDIYAMKEQYRRTVSMLNAAEAKMEATQAAIERNRTPKPEPIPEPEPEPIPVMEEIIEPKAEKIEKISLEELARRMGVKPEKPQPKPKPKKSDIEVIDLHAEEILPSLEGLASGEILSAQMSRFTIALDSAIASGKHGKMVFIHGVGKGKLKYEMTKLLGRSYPKIAHQDASFKEYGYGAIMIFY